MVLTGTATSHITVQGVRVNPANVEWDSSLYRGPAFHELDPDLQVRGIIDEERARPNQLSRYFQSTVFVKPFRPMVITSESGRATIDQLQFFMHGHLSTARK